MPCPSPAPRVSASQCARACGLLLALLALLPAVAANAGQRFPVDDSASQVLQPVLPMRWEQLVPGPGASNRVRGETVVLVRLDLRPWAGRRARIVMSLPATRFGSLDARWTTQGRLLAGELQSGGDALVFEGVVPAEGRLEDTLRLQLSTDGRLLSNSESLTFGFAIEPVESP